MSSAFQLAMFNVELFVLFPSAEHNSNVETATGATFGCCLQVANRFVEMKKPGMKSGCCVS